MSLIVVLIAVSGVVGTAWVRGILTDEERYVRAVAPLGGSSAFAGLAGAAVSMASQRGRRRPRLRLPGTVARPLGRLTTRVMGTSAFRRSWIPANRRFHRHRPAGIRVVVSMLALAAMGTVVRVGRDARPGERTVRS